MYKIVIIQCVALLCYALVPVCSMEKTSMYMKTSEVNDQAMSGSGYSYNVHDGKPQEYSFELGDDGHGLKILRDLGYDPFAETERYAQENAALPYEQYTKEYAKTAEEPAAFLVNENSYQRPKVKLLYPHVTEYGQLGIYPLTYPYAAGYNHNNFLKTGGKFYDDFGSSKHGENVDKGYKTLDAFSKGLSGKYDNKDAKSYFDHAGGKKHLVFDDAGNYAVVRATGKTSHGGSFGQKDSHDKGSKTTGFHKVYHKDDYNKQHSFYDQADKNGHFNKYGDFNAKNGNAQGHFAKGGHEDRGYEGNKYGLSDATDKGKFEDVAKGFRKADGNEGFYKDYADFSKKGGKESSSLEGYSA